ncbi:MAG: acyl-CoA thioesterase [Betaproteobacteria bacterium]|nr:acyl-CoA thioesterase [Betaproteobacteria bacterium]
MNAKTERSARSHYPQLHLITTRWHDNDVYGHINNVQYYAFFDTTVNYFLLQNQVLDLQHGEVIGLVAETGCRYFAPIAFPELVIAGLRVAHIGNSSVRYEIGLFRGEAGDRLGHHAAGEQLAVAEGYFVHVYVDAASRQPAPLPLALVRALAPLETGPA